MATLVIVLIAAAIVLLALGVLAWVRGWSAERFLQPLKISATEAGERTADLATDFWDWLRRGR